MTSFARTILPDQKLKVTQNLPPIKTEVKNQDYKISEDDDDNPLLQLLTDQSKPYSDNSDST